ncbi:hypothetical protein [Steroidobacter agaridevorans]|uniref:hypothetical protein n=1 Tax=Steroidobacter agaridevorans TaxID=2695856 RepID=UPI0013797981|nr:hypothetical protein [Steroidobacter agaridevorans]
MGADAPRLNAVPQRWLSPLAIALALLWLLIRSTPALAQTPEPGAEPPPPQDEPVQPEPDIPDDAPEQPEQPGDKPEPNEQDVNQGPLRDPVLQQDEAEPATLEREPHTEDPAAAGPPQDKKDETGPMEICAQPPAGDVGVLQRVRRSLTVGACASSAWLDGLFGNQIYRDEYHATYGTVTTGLLWSEYDGFDPRLRFRARLQLPQWDERISAFAGRVGEEDYISDTEGDFDALPTRQFGTLEDESVLVGLGYSSPERTGNDFDAGVGVRIDLPLDPYARARYEIVRSFAERYVFSARETVFWQNTEGFGTTTRINLDRVISDRFLLRWSNLGKFTEETIGLEWYSQLTLFQSVGQRTGLAWQAQVEGETDNEVQMTRTAARLIMRRQLTPEWLILELRGGVSWPRRKLSEEREPSPEIGIAIEMQFGQKRDRLRPPPPSQPMIKQ